MRDFNPSNLPIGSRLRDDEGDYFTKTGEDQWHWTEYEDGSSRGVPNLDADSRDTIWADYEVQGYTFVSSPEDSVNDAVSKVDLMAFLMDHNTTLDRSLLIRELIEKFGLEVPTKKLTLTVEVEVDRGFGTDPEDILRVALNDPNAVVLVNEEPVR